MKKVIEYTCPVCGAKLELNTYPVISLQEDKDLYEDLFSMNIFRVKCPKCNESFTLVYDMLIIDLYKKYIIYFLNKDSADNPDVDLEKILTKVKSDLNTDLSEIKYYRLVTYNTSKNNSNEALKNLLEKLLIFDYDLNDIVLEHIKTSLNPDLINNYPEIYFLKIDRDKLIFACMNSDNNKEVKPKTIAVDIKDYNNIIDLIGGLPEEKQVFSIVNRKNFKSNGE